MERHCTVEVSKEMELKPTIHLFIHRLETELFKRSGNFPGQRSKWPSQRNIPPVVTAITRGGDGVSAGLNIMQSGLPS